MTQVRKNTEGPVTKKVMASPILNWVVVNCCWSSCCPCCCAAHRAAKNLQFWRTRPPLEQTFSVYADRSMVILSTFIGTTKQCSNLKNTNILYIYLCSCNNRCHTSRVRVLSFILLSIRLALYKLLLTVVLIMYTPFSCSRTEYCRAPSTGDQVRIRSVQSWVTLAVIFSVSW